MGGAAVAYDDRQNIAATAAGSYGYDAFSRLTSASVAGTSTAFAYDPAGRLYQAGTSTRFLYDGVQAIGEYDASGNVLKRYVPGLGLDAVLTAYEGATTADRRWLLADERGSVIVITGDAAQVLATNTYDEYGQPGSGNAGRFQYTGQMWLPQAQLYHYRARAYAPGLGRFMQTDPIGYQAGANIYAYVGADPVNMLDPLGLTRCVSTTNVTCVGEVVVTADPCSRSGVMCIEQITQVDDIVVTGFREIIRTAKNNEDLTELFDEIGICPIAQAEVVGGAIAETELGVRGAAAIAAKLDGGTVRGRMTLRPDRTPRFDARVTWGAQLKAQLTPFVEVGDGVETEVSVPDRGNYNPFDNWHRTQDNFVGLRFGGALILGFDFKAGANIGSGCSSKYP